jgi:hypothetical protein
VLEVLKGLRSMPLCNLEAVEVVLEVMEGVRCVLRAVKDVRRVLEVLEVLNGVRCVLWIFEIMLRTLFCILEIVEGELGLLEMLRGDALCALEGMR